MQRVQAIIATISLSILAAGCGRQTTEENEQAAEGEEALAEAAPASEPAPASNVQQASAASVSVGDIDRWQRGMEAELKAIREAAAKLGEAKDESSKLEALHASTDMVTIDAAAAAAGIDRDSYRRVRNVFSDATSQLSPIESEMDVSQMPAEMVEQMKQARAESVKRIEGELPPDVLEALKARALELRTLEKTVVGERLKVAMSAR